MNQAKRIGLLMDNATSYGRNVFAGVRRYFMSSIDFEVLVGEPSVESFRRWEGMDPDGIIAHIQRPELAEALRGWGGPVVNVSGALEEDFVRVGVDDLAIGRMAGSYFLDRHFEHFGYVGFSDRNYSRRRLEGFREGLGGRPVAAFEQPRGEGILDREIGPWITRQPQPIGILVIGDEHALRVCKLCQDAGIGIPEPVAILSGTNDEQYCALSQPTLSAVDLPGEQIGYEAATCLDRMLRGESPPAEPLLIAPSHVHERESTNVELIDDGDVSTALSYIRDHATESIGVEDVVAGVSTGRRNLERKFASLLGHSIYHHIVMTRLNKAKALLRTTDLDLNAVARQSGFAGAQHLCKMFKNKEGITPGDFRNNAVKTAG